jgi:SAM-dependent methyltransferase
MPARESPPAALPPLVTLYQLGTGHYFSRALGLAVKLGIAGLLEEGPRDAADLAKATGTHAPSLRRMLRLLASVGVFEERENGSFALTPVGEILRPDVPGSARALVMLFAGERIHESWAELEHCVRTGEPVFRKRGLDDPFAGYTPEEEANFDAAMADATKLTAVGVAAAYDFTSLRTIVDVGGGNGALLIGILEAHPHLRGIVFDRPGAAERARKEIAAHGLAERCEAVGGDFFEEVPRGADAVLMKHVIHDWDDEDSLRILRNCHRALGAGGKVLIVEGVYPPRIEPTLEGRGAAANDVNMLVNTGGRQRSEAEFRALYSKAGFELTRILPTPARVSVIEGVRK